MTGILGCDVLVTGGGSTGAAVAGTLACSGLDVVLLEARPLDQAGASWWNTIPPWMFDRAGIARPEPPEREDAGHDLHVLAPEGTGRVTVRPSPVWDVDMPRLVARLQDRARRAGARLLGEARVVGLRLEGDRPVELEARVTEDGRTRSHRYRARLFVDASGHAGAIRRRVPLLDRTAPVPSDDDLCSASQSVFAVRDRQAARGFLERHGARPGEVLSWTGVEGGFSTVSLRLGRDLETVSILTGASQDRHRAAGPRLMERTRQRHLWVGAELRSGAGVIPLRRPYARLGAPGAVLVGDAGAMVFPAHGSGVGPGLVAARLLADAVRGAPDPGDPEVTWAYQAAVHREIGAVNAAYDVFRRMVQRLSAAEIGRLLDAGLVGSTASACALAERMPRLGLQDLGQLLDASPRGLPLVPRIGGALLRMPATHALSRRHPRQADLRALRRWSRAMSALAGGPAEG